MIHISLNSNKSGSNIYCKTNVSLTNFVNCFSTIGSIVNVFKYFSFFYDNLICHLGKEKSF